MQDVFFLWANTQYASHAKKPFFIEVGANEPKDGSNTYYLERLGWDGLLVEPNPVLATKLRMARSVRTVQIACSSVSGLEMTLVVPNSGTGRAFISHDVPTTDERLKVEYKVTTQRLSDLINEMSAENMNVYLSIDVEGHEIEVLEGLDFKRHLPSAIAIEHNYDASRKLKFDRILESVGYRKVLERISWFDSWYIRTSETGPNSFRD
jgi:FkbM family methyltransferase